jgi:hypothetical protein
MKTVVAIHTAFALVESTKALFAEHLPGHRLINIADESLIQDVISNNGLTPAIRKRLMNYYHAAIDAGADVIYNSCSSVGDIAITARDYLPVPLVKIDDAMAKKAAEKYSKIAVLATLPTTLDPTIRLVQKFANEQGKEILIEGGLAEGAFAAVMSGDGATHDRLILETAMKLADKVECFVLAQGSMARMEATLMEKTGKAVLSSPLLGMQNLKAVVESL